MAIFRKAANSHRYALHVSMAGLKMGDRVLQVGCGDGRLFAAIGVSTGLTGRASAVDENEATAARAREAANKDGVLGEVEVSPYRSLPFEDGAFDLVIINDLLSSMRPEDRVGCLQEAHRVLRPGGRCLVIAPAPRGGLAGLLGRRLDNPSFVAHGGTAGALSAEGFRGVRTLAERDGVSFIEGAKSRSAS